jgi:hypothetical protein
VDSGSKPTVLNKAPFFYLRFEVHFIRLVVYNYMSRKDSTKYEKVSLQIYFEQDLMRFLL